MLSVPTLWIVFTVNFIALGLVWAYVARRYPNLEAARFWTVAAFLAVLGSATSMLRMAMPPAIPVILSATLLIAASGLGTMGVERFYRRPISWRLNVWVVAFAFTGMTLFILWRDDMVVRILIYSVAQSILLATTLPLLLSRQSGGRNPGAQLAGILAVFIIAINAIRAVTSMMNVGGEVTLIYFNAFQAGLLLVLVFLSMMWNFGFLLMAIDRLHAEVADLAMFDDLTGTANRRQLLARLDEECARSHRSGEPFALLMIDLDGFKDVNDAHGHAAGDECLRLFTRAAQSRLRKGDLLARMGGDEFCVVLPSTTLREGAMVARHILEACQNEIMLWNGAQMLLSASIGVAQWRPEIALHAERLIAAADRALYIAKNDGKNGYAVFDVTPLESGPDLRKTA